MGIFSQENIRKSIKKTILSIYCPLRNIALKAKWQFEYISLKNKKNGKGTTPKNISECSFSHVLYIVPHADDELISGWSYQKRNNHNTTLYYCGFTGSNSFEENIKTRRNEIKKYADCMALMLIEKKDDIKKEILNLVLKEKTDAIFLPCYIDWHHEHRLINDILEGIDFGKKIKIIWYSITVPLTNKACNLYSCMSKQEQTEKWKSFKEVYKSQHMPILRLKIQERLNAISIGYNYASEPFYIFEDFEIYRNHLSKLKKIIADEELDKLKNKINDIRNIRKITNKYFEQIELK